MQQQCGEPLDPIFKRRTMNLGHNDQLSSYAIRARAYELWLEAGRPNGTSLALWLKAETEITRELEAASEQASQAASGNLIGDSNLLSWRR